MTEEEIEKYFRDYIYWQHEGLDIEKQQCLFINFGVNMKFEYSQLRRVITIFGKIINRHACNNLIVSVSSRFQKTRQIEILLDPHSVSNSEGDGLVQTFPEAN